MSVARIRGVVLAVGAGLGVACLLFALAAVVFDLSALIFRSGSMSPAIETGALAIARSTDGASLETGDVVSVQTESGTRVTHRIVSLEQHDHSAVLTLKGDDNSTPDPRTYRVQSADRVLFDIPKLGYVVSWLSGPFGIFALGLYAAFLLSVIFGRRQPAGRGPHGSTPGAHAATAIALMTTVALAAGSPAVTPTQAAWTDTATAASGAFKAHYLQRVDAMSCTTGPSLLGLYGGYVDFGITHKSDLYDYALRVYDGTTLKGEFPVASGSTVVGQVIMHRLTASQVSSLLSLGGSVQVRVYSKLKVAATWSSTPYRQWRVDTSLLNIFGLGLVDGIKCGVDTTGAADVTGPSITFSAPTNGASSSYLAYQTAVRNVCTSGHPGCGTVSDPSGLASVSYRLTRVGNTLGTRYFHASSTAGGIWNTDDSFEPAQLSGGSWSFDGLISTAYIANGDFTLTVQAVDKAGNSTSTSINFTLT